MWNLQPGTSWSLLRNNMATNLQMSTSSYGRCFAACDCWTQTSLAGNAAKQWLLIEVSHAVLYCVKISMSEAVAMPPQVWKIHCYWEPEWIAQSNYVDAGFLSDSIKQCSLLESVYAGVWEYVLLVEVWLRPCPGSVCQQAKYMDLTVNFELRNKHLQSYKHELNTNNLLLPRDMHLKQRFPACFAAHTTLYKKMIFAPLHGYCPIGVSGFLQNFHQN